MTRARPPDPQKRKSPGRGASSHISEHGTTSGDHPTDGTPTTQEPPEYGNSRRKFLIAMFMLNAIPAERVVERIAAEVVAEIER